MPNKKCIFTYITGEYDTLQEPVVVTPGWDYICFTDSPNIASTTWNIRPLHKEDMQIKCPKRRGNAIVMKYYEYISDNYDICMIIDGNIRININLEKFLKDVGYDNNQHDLLIPLHPTRDCIYEEAKAIVQLNKDSNKNISKHLRQLQETKYPRKNGLHATSLFILNNNSDNTRNLFKTWHDAYCAFSSKRDQMTFNYAIWRLKKEYDIDIRICKCEFYYAKGKPLGVYDTLFKRIGHRKR